jgi:hypothetical protein
MTLPEFKPFPKMARLSREIIVTEKLDGTNASIHITEEGDILAGSRNRWITPVSDNYGFAAWVRDHRDELLTLGAGTHFGEWWGNGIQRGYSLTEKRFSLFNTSRGDNLPACCHLVPILYQGEFCTVEIDFALRDLSERGSRAAPGFMRAEGLVVFHTAANVGFKKTLQSDDAKGRGK